MSDSIQNFRLGTIESIDLGSADIGGNINNRLGTINENFNKIVQNDYLKGSQGDSIYVVSVDFQSSTDLNNVDTICYQTGANGDLVGYTKQSLYAYLVYLITAYGSIQVSDWIGRIKLSISLLCKRDEQGRDILVSSLPIIFIDQWYLENTGNLVSNAKCPYDLSCVIYFSETENEFKKSFLFPQIYAGNNGEFYWKINGVRTQIPVRGLQGPQGEPGVAVYFVTYQIEGNGTYKIVNVYYENEWKSFSEVAPGIANDAAVLAIATNLGTSGTTNTLRLGYISKNNDDGTATIRNSIGLDMSLEMLLTNNASRCLYIPSLKDPADHHVMKSELYSQEGQEDRGVLKMDVLEYNTTTGGAWGEGSKATAYKFINNYGLVEYTGAVTHDGNVIHSGTVTHSGAVTHAGPVIVIGQGNELKSTNGATIIADQLSAKPTIVLDGNKVKITAGGKTSDPQTIPFATNAAGLTSAGKPVVSFTSDNKIKITAGGQTSDPQTVPFATNASKLGAKPASSFTSLKPVIGQSTTPIEISNGSIVFISDSVVNRTWKWSSSLDLTSNTDTNISIIQFSINYPYDDDNAKNFKLSDHLKASNANSPVPVGNLNFYYPTDSSTPNPGTNIRCEQIYTGYKTSNEIDFFVNTCYYQIGS